MNGNVTRTSTCGRLAGLMLVICGAGVHLAEGGQGTSMTLAEEGKPAATIVMSADASEFVKEAVKDLQLYIGKMSGATLPIVDSSETPGNLILVGRMPEVDRLIPDLDEYDLGHDGVVIRQFPGKLVITGKSGGFSNGASYTADVGTPNAIYYFLESLGCRWYMPGDDGEVVPRRRTIKISGMDIVSKADYKGRWLLENRVYGVHRQEFRVWARRIRAAQGANLYHHTHGMYDLLPPALFKEHPEYFGLVNGQRRGPPAAQFCLSNPDVLDVVTTNLVKILDKQTPWRSYGCGQYDCIDWCQCDSCQSWYGEKTFVYKTRLGARAIGRAPGDKVFPNIANGYLKFMNALADRIATTHPGLLLNYYALYNIPGVPEVAPRDNVMPVMCHLAPNDEGWRREVERWARVSKQMYYYTYMGHQTAFPKFTIIKDIRWAYEHKGIAMFLEVQEHSPVNTLALYLAARAMWDTKVEAEPILAEFYRLYYGAAEAPMREFWQRFHEITLEAVLEHDCHHYPDTLTPQVAAEFRECLTKAMALARRPVVKRRIEHVGSYWRVAELQVEARRALAEWKRHKTSRNHHAARTALVKTIQYIDAAAPALWLKGRLGLLRLWLSDVGVDKARVIMDLPVTWRFKKDPSDVGMKQQWFAGGVDSSWVDISTEKGWTKQGHDYHGVAWYRIPFVLPAEWSKQDEEVVLFFGAVDGYADIFLDGVKIGEQKKPPAEMWSMPFTIALPANMARGKTHQLVVRVEKKNFAAGIWRPVRIARRAK